MQQTCFLLFIKSLIDYRKFLFFQNSLLLVLDSIAMRLWFDLRSLKNQLWQILHVSNCP